MGRFQWSGDWYEGKYEKIISLELWQKVQDVMKSRVNAKSSNKHFAFSGLVNCGKCGCAFTAQMKKGRYIYYHCTGNKGKHGDPVTKESEIADAFRKTLQMLELDPEIFQIVKEALIVSGKETNEYRDRALIQLKSELTRTQNRLQDMYLRKLDGDMGTDLETYNRVQDQLMRDKNQFQARINELNSYNKNYLNAGVSLIELLQRVVPLYDKQEMHEKRRLIDFVCSNSIFKDGELTVTFRKPFDLIADMKRPVERAESKMEAKNAKTEIGGGVRESNPPAPASANARTALKAAGCTSTHSPPSILF